MQKEKFLKEYLVERKGTYSLKWDALDKRFGNANLTSMWVADMEIKAPKEVIEALKERCEHGVFGYSYVSDEYYNSVINWLKEKHNYEIKKEWLRFTNGVVTAIYCFVNIFTKVDDAVLILTPVYYPFHNAVKDNNRKLITCDLKNTDGYFTIDYEEVEKKIVENNVKLFIQCSPHNPAGRVWKEEELAKILEICKKHNVLVISDEIHQDIIMKGYKHIPSAIVANGKYADNLITISAASKTFNLAGLIHSNIIISNDELRKKYDKEIKKINQTEINILGMLATQVAYEKGSEWLENVKEIIEDNFNYLKTELNKHIPEITITNLEGTYLVFLDLRKIIPIDKVKEFIQDKCNLAIDFGEWFGASFKGFIRINLATDPEIVKKAVESIIFEYKKLK
ncbi:MalY/PatB family protein [Fusobacterium pseudoperiodonticum]|uniref:MalY/PatB family protein n=1 Tax=Fusobacterium pseudoperiodonticum TaxID=2663009 RepID=UPI000C1B3123|nr:MalY/PatB family protein [Fusobacterium pseudoperiodonticum]ATV56358.1 aminotransferase [Fusobacterium pseudoperiodonticum]ATV69087.1 aminotransferase [Fusobacterium pseudoperiodonticum]PIM77970.1 aminotransferase [Fusobacterium pseudoperiodonticum]